MRGISRLFCKQLDSRHIILFQHIGENSISNIGYAEQGSARMTSPAGNSFIPQWDGRSNSLETYEQRVKLYVMGTKKDERVYCAARLLGAMDPLSDAFKIGSALSTTVLEAEDGAQAVVTAIIAAQGPQTMQEAVKLFRDLWRLHRRNNESMQKWTTRFQLHVGKTGRSLHASCTEISPTRFLHSILQGMMLLEGTGLTPQEQAAVLATSGKVGKLGAKIGNSYDIEDITSSLIAQWSEDDVVKRDRAHRGRARADAMNAWNLDNLAAALPETEETGDEAYGAIEEEWPEDEFYEGEEGFEEVPEEETYAAGEEEEQETEVVEAYASAARTFAEAKELLAKTRAARGYFPVVGVGVWEEGDKGQGKGAHARGRGAGRTSSAGRKGGRKGKSGGRKGDGPPPAKMRTTFNDEGRGAARGGRHHAGRTSRPPHAGLSPDQCLLCRGFGHRAAECPNVGQQSTAGGAKRAFGSFVGMVLGADKEVPLVFKSNRWRWKANGRFAKRHDVESAGLVWQQPMAASSTVAESDPEPLDIREFSRSVTRGYEDDGVFRHEGLCEGDQPPSDHSSWDEESEEETPVAHAHMVMTKEPPLEEAPSEPFDDGEPFEAEMDDPIPLPVTEESLACFDMATLDGLGLIDGGATRTVGSVEQVQKLVDATHADGRKVKMVQSAVQFTYAGGDRDSSSTAVEVPVPALDNETVRIQTVSNRDTPLLLGADTLRRFGLVVDYAHNRVYSHRLQREIAVVILPSGHLAINLTELATPASSEDSFEVVGA